MATEMFGAHGDVPGEDSSGVHEGAYSSSPFDPHEHSSPDHTYGAESTGHGSGIDPISGAVQSGAGQPQFGAGACSHCSGYGQSGGEACWYCGGTGVASGYM